MSEEHSPISVKVATYHPSHQSQTLPKDVAVEAEAEADPEYASFIISGQSVSNESDSLEAHDLTSVIDDEPIQSREDARKRILLIDAQIKKIQNEKIKNNLERLNDLLAVKPQDSETLYQKGCALILLERYNEAMEDLQKASNHVETDSSLQDDVSIALAECLFKTGQNDQAKERFSKLAESSPGDWRAFFGLGMCESASGQFERAIEEFQKAAALNPTDKEIRIKIARCEKCIGDSLIAQTRVQDAIESYTRAIDIHKDNVMFYCKRGLTYFALGNKAKAYEDFEQATQLYKTKMDDVMLAKENTANEAIFVDKVIREYVMSGFSGF